MNKNQLTISGVVFDAVGTLIHPQPPAAEVYAIIGRRFGSRRQTQDILPRFAEAFAAEEVTDLEAGYRTSETREYDRWRNIVAQVLDDVAHPQECFAQLFEHFQQPNSWCCDSETHAILTELQNRGFRLGMASNFDARLRAVAHGWKDLQALEPIIISSEVGWRKPAPEFFAAVCRQMGLPAERIIFIGDDRGNDFDGAIQAGMSAILFDPRARDKNDNIPRITRLTEVCRCIETIASTEFSANKS